MIITNETDRELALKAIEVYDRSKLEFVVGESYQWKADLKWPNKEQHYGPMKCLFVNGYQGVFIYAEPRELEYVNGLHIVSTAHLKSGAFLRFRNGPRHSYSLHPYRRTDFCAVGLD